MLSSTEHPSYCRDPFLPVKARALFLCCLVLVMSAMVQGCGGYNLAADEPSILGSPQTTIHIREVETPSLYPGLSALIRATLRDEITNRNLATWRDHGTTDYSIKVIVDKMTFAGSATGRDKANRLFNASVTLKLALYDEHTNTVIWDSGLVAVNESYRDLSGSEEQAMEGAVQKAIQYIVDRMRYTF